VHGKSCSISETVQDRDTKQKLSDIQADDLQLELEAIQSSSSAEATDKSTSDTFS